MTSHIIFRTFGKVRSVGDELVPIPSRPVEMRSKTVILSRRVSAERNESRSSLIRRQSMEKVNSQPSTPVMIRSGIKGSPIETPPGTPDVRRSSSSDYRSVSVDGRLYEGGFSNHDGFVACQ